MVESNVENQKYGYKDSVPKFRNIMGCNKIKHFYLNFDWSIWSLNTFFSFLKKKNLTEKFMTSQNHK